MLSEAWPAGRSGVEKDRFRSTTAGLGELEAWLAERQVQLVAMEAAGVYWKLVLYALESRFTVWLCNGRSGGQEGPARMGFLLGLSGRPARPIAFAVVATMRTGFEVGPGGVPVRRS